MANMAPSYRLPGSEPALQEDQVQPALELVADLAQVAALFKAEPLMKADRGGVGGIDAGDHDVFAERGGARQQSLHQQRADAAAAAGGAYVHGMQIGRASCRE